MSFSNQSCIWLRFRDLALIVGLTIPPGEQSNNSRKINQARENPHQQAAQLLVFGGRQSPLILHERQDAEPVDRMKINGTNFHGREREDDSQNGAAETGAEQLNNSRQRRESCRLPGPRIGHQKAKPITSRETYCKR